MTLLAVDTALGACSAAVLEDGRVRAHRWESMARGHAEALAPMVEAVMGEAGIAFSALDRLAVTTGPGTFTGQRVGLAFMRGLRVALGRPLVGVTTLEAIAAAAAVEAPAAGAVAVLHEARRGEVYGALYRGAETVMPPRVEDCAAMLDEILAWQRESGTTIALAGTAAEAGEAVLTAPGFVLTRVTQPDALWVGRLALSRPVPEGPPAPLYLRAADARLAPDAIAIRPAGVADAAVLAALHNETLPESWEAGFIAGVLADGYGQALIAEARGVPVGFALSRVVADEAELLAIGVHPATRRSGIAARLLRGTAARANATGARTIFLEVAVSNIAARKLYEAHGFHVAVTRRGYYRGGGDALLMRAALPFEHT